MGSAQKHRSTTEAGPAPKSIVGVQLHACWPVWRQNRFKLVFVPSRWRVLRLRIDAGVIPHGFFSAGEAWCSLQGLSEAYCLPVGQRRYTCTQHLCDLQVSCLPQHALYVAVLVAESRSQNSSSSYVLVEQWLIRARTVVMPTCNLLLLFDTLVLAAV